MILFCNRRFFIFGGFLDCGGSDVVVITDYCNDLYLNPVIIVMMLVVVVGSWI